jgi:hypothetical protein
MSASLGCCQGYCGESRITLGLCSSREKKLLMDFYGAAIPAALYLVSAYIRDGMLHILSLSWLTSREREQ